MTVASALIALFILVGYTFIQLCFNSIDKSRSIRSEIFDRDLRDLVSHFDADERYVLDSNIKSFLAENRELKPLLLPRQYYVALPHGQSKFIPRPPPRNCFVDLKTIDVGSESPSKFPEKFCSYFADNKNLGTYLFMSMAFSDSYVKLLSSGDVSFNADAIRVEVESSGIVEAWLITMQLPAKMPDKGRYQLTAFRLREDGRKEIDKRFEGWAYIQEQVNSSAVLNLIARLDFKEFIQAGDEHWPPTNWDKTKVRLSRADVSQNGQSRIIKYDNSGASNLSITSLSPAIFNAYGILSVKKNGVLWPVNPPSSTKSIAIKGDELIIKSEEGDLLIRQNPIVRSQLLQDTNIEFSVQHPGTVLERSIWVTGALLVLSLLGFLFLFGFFFIQLLKPIWILSRQSRQLISEKSRVNLPYSDRNDEIGALAKGFNELLKETREQAEREQEEREKRAAEDQKRHSESVKAREQNLQIIGHEIREPLQALRSIHKSQSDKSWRYIDRITKAVTQLFGASGPEATLAARDIILEELKVGVFLQEVAKNSPLAGIPNINFTGSEHPVIVDVDPSVLEDVISNILTNAHRYREPDSEITIKLSTNKGFAIIEIFNKGPLIPEDNLSKIFELYFTTEPAENQIHGNGIGLYAAKNYINRMDGTITAVNEMTGVNFIIRLPIKGDPTKDISNNLFEKGL